MKTLSQVNVANIKSIILSETIKKDGIKLQILTVEFVGIGNETYQLLSAEYVTESEHKFQFTQRIGERFSGLGSSDGMRDEYHTIKINDIQKYEDPSMRKYVYKVKSNSKKITGYSSNFNVKEFE